jgi:hypothetical protein
MSGQHDGGCEFWPKEARAPEKFTGPWNASLEYPLLIVSNTVSTVIMSLLMMLTV